MSEIDLYENVQIPNSKKAQVKEVYFNKKYALELKDMRLINALEFKFIFFHIPKWLMEATNHKSTKLYGKITEVRPKAIKINFSEWFPKSQILKVFYLKETDQINLIKFMDDKYYEQKDKQEIVSDIS